MDIRTLTPRYSVSPQIALCDPAAVVAAGFTTLICNRPDSEVPAALQSDRMAEAAEAAGLTFHFLPLTHQTMTAENVGRQKQLIDDSPGAVLAYCASGTRCSIIWALGQAGEMPTAEILEATTRAGYALHQLAPQLDHIARQKST